MKLPITDKFLWEMYKYIEKADDVLDFILSNKYRQGRILMGGENPVFRKYQKEMGKRNFSKFVYYIKKCNYIKVEGLKSKKTIIFTKDGISKVLKASFKSENKKKRKDGKWIMIIFDVPEKYPKTRNLLRSLLHNLEYKLLQQSVWVTPYDVLEKTEQLLQLHSLDDYVKIFLIEKQY